MFNILVLLFGLLASPAFAQNTTCANKAAADSSNACANTRYVTTALTNAYPLMWLKSAQGTGVNAVATGYNAASQALFLNGTYTGSGTAPYSLFSVSDTGSASTNGFRSGLWVAYNIGVSAGEANRAALLPIFTIANPLPCTSGGTKCFHAAAFPQLYVSANLGGTAGANNSRGDVYGAGVLAQATSGATYMHGIVGQETDVSVQTGASVDYKAIASFISVNSDAVGGSVFNSMVYFAADQTTTYKWPKGITFGVPAALWPFDTSSNIIDSTAPALGSRVANNGIEFSSITFSGCSFKSNNFCIAQSGAASVASLASTGAVSGTTGNFSSTLSASTITSTGAAAGFVAAPRSGSGNNYQWYNPSGTGIRLTDGGSDLVTIDSVGAIVTASNVTNLHNYSTVSVPAASSCGGSPTVDAGSSNHAGKITFGSATTACTLTFASAFANNAFCTVTPGAQPAAVANIPYISAQSKTAFTISGGTASAVYYWNCGGN
jgi:hypothetical protein